MASQPHLQGAATSESGIIAGMVMALTVQRHRLPISKLSQRCEMLMPSLLNILDRCPQQAVQIWGKEKSRPRAQADEDSFAATEISSSVQSSKKSVTPAESAGPPSLDMRPSCIVIIQRGYEEFLKMLDQAMKPPPPPGLDVFE